MWLLFSDFIYKIYQHDFGKTSLKIHMLSSDVIFQHEIILVEYNKRIFILPYL